MATTTPNFGWPVPTSTDLVKDGATAIEALGDGIDASLVDLKGGTTGQVLAKTSGTDLDFTWVTTDDTNAIQNAIVDAKGDLIAASANDTPARLAVGTNGQILIADSTASTGLAYETQSMRLVGSTSFTTQSAVSLDSLFSSTYENYKVFVTVNASSQVVLNYRLRASGSDNTTSAYSNQYLIADNTTVVASRSTGLTSGSIGQMVLNGYSGFEVNVFRPFESDATILRSVTAGNVAGGFISDYQSNFSTATSFTGFSIIPTSGTITGTMRVYGLRNS